MWGQCTEVCNNYFTHDDDDDNEDITVNVSWTFALYQLCPKP